MLPNLVKDLEYGLLLAISAQNLLSRVCVKTSNLFDLL
jgi:hypothetical protein